MRPCHTQFSFLLNFVSRRINSRHSSTCVTSQQIFKDYAIQEINLLLWLAFFGITALLLRKLFLLCKIWVYACRIPRPPSPPFYGHSSLFSTANPHLHLTELLVKSHKKYGTIVKLWLSPTQLLVSIKEPSLVNDMLSKASDKMPLVGRVYRLAFGQCRFFVSSFEKIYSEVIVAQKGPDKLTKPDVSKMHLLLATVYESARLLPAGPLLQRCSLKHDMKLKNGIYIPAGALLVAPIQLIQMDECNWGSDAGKFNPYRFLSKAGVTLQHDGTSENTGEVGAAGGCR